MLVAATVLNVTLLLLATVPVSAAPFAVELTLTMHTVVDG
jgi:hypothetical protein